MGNLLEDMKKYMDGKTNNFTLPAIEVKKDKNGNTVNSDGLTYDEYVALDQYKTKKENGKETQSYNKGYEKSGKTRDDYDASVRSGNSKKAESASSAAYLPLPGTEKKKETVKLPSPAVDRSSLDGDKIEIEKTERKPFYSLPDLDYTEEEKKTSETVSALEKKLKQNTTLTSATEKMVKSKLSAYEDAQKRLDNCANEIKTLEAQYSASPSAEIAQRHDVLVDEYDKILSEIKDISASYDSYVNDYKDILKQSDTDIAEYNAQKNKLASYTERANTEYEKWRASVRSSEIVRAEADALDKAIAELEKELTREFNPIEFIKKQANPNWSKPLKEKLAALKSKRDITYEELSSAEAVEKAEYYASYTERTDFAENSAFESTYGKGKPHDYSAPDASSMTIEETLNTVYGDIKYDYINGDEEARAHVLAFGLPDPFEEYGYMENVEIAIYNYIYRTEGKERAEFFLSDLLKDLTYRQKTAESKEYKAYADEHPALGSLLSILTNTMKPFATIGQLGDYLLDGEIDPNASYNRASYLTSSLREGASADMNAIGKFLYQTGMSIADFATVTALTGGSGASLAIMGMSSAADTTIEAKERGLSDGKAILLGAASGLIEAATEKIGLDNLMDIIAGGGKGVKGALKAILKQALAEGGEEVLSAVGNDVVDILVSLDKSKWETEIDALMENDPSLSRNEAWGKVCGSHLLEYGLSGLGGMISGAVTGGAGVGIKALTGGFKKLDTSKIEKHEIKTPEEAKTEKNDIKYPEPYEIILDAEKAPTYSDYYKYAEQVAKSGELTAENILRLEELWEKRQHTTEALSEIKELAGEGMTLEEVEKSVRENYDVETITYAEIEDAYNEAAETTFVQSTEHQSPNYENNAGNIATTEAVSPAENTTDNDTAAVDKIKKAIPELSEMDAVSTLTGNEFPKSSKKLTEQVGEFFASLKNKITRKGFGEVIINNDGIKSSIAHGLGRAKSVTFAAVPDVIANGKQIDYQENWKGRGYNTYIFAAPVKIGEETGYVGVVVTKSEDANKYYLHEVIDSEGNVFKINKDADLFKTGSFTDNSASTSKSASSDTIISQNADFDNTFSENNNENATNEGENGYESEFKERNTDESEGGNDISDGSGKRNAGESSPEPSGELGQSTKGWKNILEGADSADEIGRARTAATLRTEHISSSSLGIANGTDTPRLRIYPEEKWDDNLKNIQSVLKKETGKEVIFVQGPIEIKMQTGIRYVRGVDLDDKIIIRMNDLKVHPENIAFHELYHERAAESPGLNEAIKEAIIEKYSEKEFNEMLEVYADKLAGVYEFDEHSDEEYNAVLDAIMEEIFADAYANINGFGVHPERFRETVVKITEAEHKRVQSLKKNAATTKKKADYSVDDTDYLSYQSLISKPDMTLSKLVIPDNYEGAPKPPRIEVVKAALSNARLKNNPKNTKENVFIRNNDTGNDILINRKGIGHGLYRNYEKNAIAYANIGDIIENSILINEHSAREGGNEGNIYLGAGWYGNEMYLCRIITNKNNSVEDLEVMYALNTKKESVAHNRLGIANQSLSNTNSTISIADFLDIVKTHYADVLPDDVLRQMSMVRPNSPISDFVKYSLSDVPIPTYEELIAKDDMEIVDLTNSYGKGRYKEQRADFMKSDEAKALLSEPVLNKDTGEKIFIVNSTFTHSFSNDKLGAEQIAAVKNIRKIIENAVLTHVENITHGDSSATGIYTLFAAVKAKDGVHPTRLKVKEYKLDGTSLPENIINYFNKYGEKNPHSRVYDNRVLVLENDGMITAGTKKEEPSSSALSTASNEAIDKYPSGSSVISIADLLSLVNSEYQKYIPKKRNGTIQKYSVDDSEVSAYDSKNDLIRNCYDIFSIPEGNRKELRSLINSFAEGYIKKGSFTDEDRNKLFDRLYAEGIMTVAADDYFKEGRAAVAKGKIYVSEGIKSEFGDDWNAMRQRAFSAGVFLTNNKKDSSVDQWNAELAELFPGIFDKYETDERAIIENIISMAEDGKDQKMSLAEYAAMSEDAGYVSSSELYRDMERRLDAALKTFAEKAKLEIKLREKNVLGEAKRRQARLEAAQRKKESQNVKEVQNETIKTLNWLMRHQNKASDEFKAKFKEVLSDIDIFAKSAADAMRWSDKYQATWQDIEQMYKDAQENDPNFLPSKEIEKIIARLNNRKVADMDMSALMDLYKAAVGLRTEYQNRKDMLLDKEQRTHTEIYKGISQEMANDGEKYTPNAIKKFFNNDQLTPMNVLERMSGWNPDGALYGLGKMLEQGEYDVHSYIIRAGKILDEFLEKNKDWVRMADGQHKKSIWYTEEIHPYLGKGKYAPETVTVHMTPAMRVYLYLESKGIDNVRHMTSIGGGRTFADKELYSKGKRAEAFAQGTTVRLSPETIKQLADPAKMTKQEQELAKLMEDYYKFAKTEINKTSNALHGFSRAMENYYAQIFTNKNYTKVGFDHFGPPSAEGSIKERMADAVNPSYCIGAFDAFERHVNATSKYVGLSIPVHNFKVALNWREERSSASDLITHKWGKEGLDYIHNMLKDIQSTDMSDKSTVEAFVSKLSSNYISAVFGLNPSIVFKQVGSMMTAATYLGWNNRFIPQKGRADYKKMGVKKRQVISQYTNELDYRTLGYSSEETKTLKDNPTLLDRNPVTAFLIRGDAITWMDGRVAEALWRWTENEVRREHPELKLGTNEEIMAGESEFYKAVAERFNYVVSRSQSMSDFMHQSTMRKSKNLVARMLTLFKSDAAQNYNIHRQLIGEALYLEKSGASKKEVQKAWNKVGRAVLNTLFGYSWAALINLLINLWKYKGKRYKYDEGELTTESVAWGILEDVFSNYAGIVVLGEELAAGVVSVIKREFRYDTDAIEIEQLNELLSELENKSKLIIDICAGAANILNNGGDVGEYFSKHSSEIIGGIRDIAKTCATYIGGLPADNFEKYLLGAVKWVSPELGAAYDDLTDTVQKKDLKELSGKALEGRISRIFDVRNVDISDETASTLAELYEAEFTDAIPSATPTKFTADKVEYELDEYKQQIFDSVWSDTVNSVINDITASRVFKNADQQAQVKMLNKLYDLATYKAKVELVKDYEDGIEAIEKANGKISELKKVGLGLADFFIISGAYTYFNGNDKDYPSEEDQANAFASWANTQGYTADQVKVINDTFVYFGMYAIKAEAYNALTDAGFSDETASKAASSGITAAQSKVVVALGEAGLSDEEAIAIVEDFKSIEPINGGKKASDYQKAELATQKIKDPAKQLIVLEEIMTTKQYQIMKLAYETYNIEPSLYIKVVLAAETLSYETTGNKKASKDELKAVLDDLNLNDGKKAQLYQFITSEDVTLNPYSFEHANYVKEDMDILFA